jgi:NIPSNAP
MQSMHEVPMNEKVYIHEFIDIIGHNRGRYMYHMTANWTPIAIEDRHQLCFGVWGVVGSTGHWPQVVNIWEEDGLDGMARSFDHELGHADLQDPKLAEWWAAAATLRSGGLDRLLAPAPWMPTIEAHCQEGRRGTTYAHEQVRVARGTSAAYLEIVRQEAVPALERFGWSLVGAWETLMGDDSECFLLWAIPTWAQWAEREQARRTEPGLVRWETRNLAVTERVERILLVEAELSPMRLGRQPARSDRTEAWNG